MFSECFLFIYFFHTEEEGRSINDSILMNDKENKLFRVRKSTEIDASQNQNDADELRLVPLTKMAHYIQVIRTKKSSKYV